MKIENSGVKTQKECDEINEYHKKIGFEFEIKPENTVFKSGLRQIAKICLHSLWGKFGQRSCMTDYDFCWDYNCLSNIVNDKITIHNWNIINDSCVEVRYNETEDYVIENDDISEITAVFKTSNARVRLYKMLDWLDKSQVAYCDTDSKIFMHDEDNPLHKNPYNEKDIIDAKSKCLEFGTGLGQWEDEFSKDEWIDELVIGGAKSYAY